VRGKGVGLRRRGFVGMVVPGADEAEDKGGTPAWERS
jgi:hypothetical protein